MQSQMEVRIAALAAFSFLKSLLFSRNVKVSVLIKCLLLPGPEGIIFQPHVGTSGFGPFAYIPQGAGNVLSSIKTKKKKASRNPNMHAPNK